MKRRITQLSQLLGLGLAISLNLFSFANFRQAALSQSTNEFRTFMDWCLNQEKLSRDAQHTVQTLLRYVNTNDCQQAAQEIALIYDLNLSINKITDISPLSVLTNLSELDLSGNQIRDISPLSVLTNLSELDLGGNQITDISPIAELTNLSYLNLRNNQITDVSSLSGLNNLSGLSLMGNPLTELNCPVEPESICIFR